MSSKLIFFVLVLITLTIVLESKNLFKKFKKFKHINEKINEYLRFREDSNIMKTLETSDGINYKGREEGIAVMELFINHAWANNKLSVLSSFLEDIADSDTNITVIGWQKIVEDQIKEINTVQLVIPSRFSSEGAKKKQNDKDDTEIDKEESNSRTLPYKEINILKEMVDLMDKIGISVRGTRENYNKNGKQKSTVCVNNKDVYFISNGLAVYNKTIVTTNKEVESFIQKQTPNILGKPSVLRYDADGQLIDSESFIYEPLLGSVTHRCEAPDDVLLQSPIIIAYVSQHYNKEEIAKQLASAYNEAFPEYTWSVLIDPVNYYITKDVCIVVSYDNFDFDESSNISYFVYGNKK